MFEDSLVESSGRIKTNRLLTTFVSFVVQMLFLGVLVLIPLIYIEALPKAQMFTDVLGPDRQPPPPPPAAAPGKVIQPETEIVKNQLLAPTQIPNKIEMVKHEAPPQMAGVVGGVAGGIPAGAMGVAMGGVGTSSLPAPKVAPQKKFRVSSGVIASNKISGPNPQYPLIAKIDRIQGQVILEATIGKLGTIENLHPVSGPPMLYQSAIDAVRQWRYKPYILNGEAVEVETTIQVNFTLSGG